jgi:long-chain acyl-CoA synthetase
MIDVNRTLYALVESGLLKNRQDFAVADKKNNEWIKITTKDFLNQVRNVALGLHSLGVRQGDKVAIHSENRSAWVISDLAITSIGAVTVPLYTTQPEEQTSYILKHAEVKAIFISSEDLAKKTLPICKSHNIGTIIIYDDIVIDNTHSFKNLQKIGESLNHSDETLFKHLQDDVLPEDLATICYTSGTMGEPKGVMLNHKNLVHGSLAPVCRVFHMQNPQENDVVMSFLPFTHIFEHCAIYGYIYCGTPVYIVSDLTQFREDVIQIKPVHFTTVPRLLEKIYVTITYKILHEKGLKGILARWAIRLTEKFELGNTGFGLSVADKLIYRKIRNQLGGKVRGITSGGAALSPKIMRFFNAIGICVGEGYGLTETSPGVAMYIPQKLRFGSVGKAMTDVEIKIASDGEILVKGPNVMQGYYKDMQATNEILVDGWLHTGDIGYFDEDGNLFITDRKKELFKLSTGKYVAPAPIENKLICSPFIEQVVLLGDQQKYCGALIYPNPEFSNLEEDTKEHIQKAIDEVNKDLPSWERIKHFVLLETPMSVETGELTPTLKKKRRIIREKRIKDIEKLYGYIN